MGLLLSVMLHCAVLCRSVLQVCTSSCVFIPKSNRESMNLRIYTTGECCVCVCGRLVPVFRAGAKNAEIRVCVCVGVVCVV